MRKTLLSVGTNLTLLRIRNAVFVNAGYRVMTSKTCAQALKLIASQPINAVVVGHSLSCNLRQKIVEAAKSRRVVVVVLHANPYEARVASADANLWGTDGASRVTQVLSELLAKPADSYQQQTRTTRPPQPPQYTGANPMQAPSVARAQNKSSRPAHCE